LIITQSFSFQAHGIIINATYDSTITSDPNAATIEATINSAIAVYENYFSDPITVNFTFQEVTNGLAGSRTSIYTFAYADYLSALQAHATTLEDVTALNNLPGGPNNPVNGNADITLKAPLARALGFSATPSTPDSTISLNISVMNISSSNPNTNYYSLFAAVSHEMDEGLGFGGGLNGLTNGQASPTDDSVEPEDLFRYDQNGARSFTTSATAIAYCAFDGVTDIARFNQYDGGGDNTPTPSHADFADWYSSPVYPPQQIYPAPEVQDAFGTPGSFPVLGVELRVLDAIGFTPYSSPIWVDFNYAGTQVGTYESPFETLAAGISAVASGGTIAIRADVQPSISGETMTISTPMTIISVEGPSSIGN
jgi:hypothetical protein